MTKRTAEVQLTSDTLDSEEEEEEKEVSPWGEVGPIRSIKGRCLDLQSCVTI